jgi:hypothetical protein
LCTICVLHEWSSTRQISNLCKDKHCVLECNIPKTLTLYHVIIGFVVFLLQYTMLLSFYMPTFYLLRIFKNMSYNIFNWKYMLIIEIHSSPKIKPTKYWNIERGLDCKTHKLTFIWVKILKFYKHVHVDPMLPLWHYHGEI